jgi:hypothetical protein
VADFQILLEATILEKERIKNVHCEYRSFQNLDFMQKIVSRLFQMLKKSDFFTTKLLEKYNET